MGVPGVAADLHALLATADARLGQPRVHALHLPPPPADGSRRGEFCAIELDDGSIGLSYVLLGNTLAALRAGPPETRVAGLSALEVARALLEPPGLARTVAWAAGQAMAHAVARRAGWSPPPAGDSLGDLQLRAGDHVGVVGLFGPLMQRLVATGARVTVIELRADLVGRYEGYEVTLETAALRCCNKVLATGTLMLNDTLDAVLAHTRAAERVALIGPSVGALPEMLFARGVHVVGGTWVEQPEAYLEALRGGAERAGAARKFSLPREAWPGWASLLART